jgi:hypothetical protein
MKKQKFTLYKKIEDRCRQLEGEFGLIPAARKEKLLSLSQYLSNKINDNQIPKLIVICTHNSRRSHIGQIWLATGADYYQLPEIQTFSGGTEATAFNIRAVEAFRRSGFKILTNGGTEENPIYQVRWKNIGESYPAFSKKYEDTPNPKAQFAAIMVCSEADTGCPFILGCDLRLSLPYDDPKAFDDTDLEVKKYDERVRQIGRELLFMLSRVDQ